MINVIQEFFRSTVFGADSAGSVGHDNCRVPVSQLDILGAPGWTISGGRWICAAILLLLPVFGARAGQSLFMSSPTGTYSVPNRPPFSNLQSFWFDVRIHDYAIPSNTCTNLVNVGGGYQLNWGGTLQMCDPASGGGLFRLFGVGDVKSQNALLVNPPGLKIIAATGTNPMTITLASPPYAISMSPGQKIHIWGVGDPGCSGLNGLHTVASVAGQNLTLDVAGAGCNYSSGAGDAFGDDVLLRFHADKVTNKMTLEVWNPDGSGYTKSWDPGDVSTWHSLVFPQSGIPLGSGQASLAYVRWCGGTLPLNSRAPWGGASQSCVGGTTLADWEFDGDGTDSGPNGIPIDLPSSRGLTAFRGSPVYTPGCNPGVQQVFRAGGKARLDGSHSFPLDGGSGLSFQWQQSGSSEPGAINWQRLGWGGQNTAAPTISGFVAGPINLQLTVTDSSGQSSVCSIHDGAVATDQNGNVIVPSGSTDPTGGFSKMSSIIGPVTQWGMTRWPWMDEQAKAWADRLGSYQGQVIPGGLVTDFIDKWNEQQAGTVDVVNGSSAVTGHNTQFQSLFCGGAGNTTPPPSSVGFVGWYTYPLTGGGGGTGRRLVPVAGCPSQTTLTLSYVWEPPSESGTSYSAWDNSGLASWINGGANINYYDNVLAFYAMYFRTGIDQYLHQARWLADRWWTMPYIDRGNQNDCGFFVNLCANFGLFPRIVSLSGMYLRSIDQDILAGKTGSSPMWPGLRQIVNGAFRYRPRLLSKIGDLRETAYGNMFVALCAAYDPDVTTAAACRHDVAEVITSTWQPARRPDGHWQAFAGDYSNLNFTFPNVNTVPGTVTVSPGSRTVTITGGTWDPAWFPRRFLSLFNFNDPATQDASYYDATFVDATTIQLDRSYAENCNAAGNSCAGRSWVTGKTWLGFGTQPFMLGIAGHWFNQAYLALSQDSAYSATAALAKSYVVDAANWISRCTLDGTGGCDPSTRGAFYSVGFGVCTPGASDGSDGCRCGPQNGNCGGTAASRENMGETFGELGTAYSYAPSDNLRSAIDNLIDAAYSKYPDDPGYDGAYSIDIESSFLKSNNPKWFGFDWGMGRNMAFASTRQGGAAPPDFVIMKVDVTIASVPGATAIRVNLTAPTGASRPSVVCQASPCLVMVDRTMGNWILQVDHLASSGATLSSGEPYVQAVK